MVKLSRLSLGLRSLSFLPALPVAPAGAAGRVGPDGAAARSAQRSGRRELRLRPVRRTGCRIGRWWMSGGAWQPKASWQSWWWRASAVLFFDGNGINSLYRLTRRRGQSRESDQAVFCQARVSSRSRWADCGIAAGPVSRQGEAERASVGGQRHPLQVRVAAGVAQDHGQPQAAAAACTNSSSPSSASSFLSLPRWPSTSRPSRCSSGWAKPGASAFSST